MRPRFYSRLPFPKEQLAGKLGELTYQRNDFLITARGKFMVAGPNADGLCEVMFQYPDQTESKWVRIYLGQKYVDKLMFPETETDPIKCEDVVNNGVDLDAKKEESPNQ